MNDFATCGLTSCNKTASDNSPHITHQVLYEKGCCEYNGEMVGEGEWLKLGHVDLLCHQGEMYAMVKAEDHLVEKMPQEEEHILVDPIIEPGNFKYFI